MSALRTAVVTGASGFLGSALTRRLGADGTRVICPLRAGSPRSARLARLPGVETIALSAFDLDTLRAALRGVKCDAVFHLAAYGVGQGERDPVAMIEGNATLSASVVAAAADWTPARFVFAGTNSEYAPAANGVRIDEDHPLRPTTLYGAAKAAAHIYSRTLALRLGVPFVGLRIFGTFGPGEAPERLIPAVISHLARGETPELTPGGHQRDLSYVDDVAEALVVAATHRGIVSGGAYNVCSGVPRRIADVARRVAELLGRPDADVGLGRRTYRPDEPEWLVGDPTRFAQATGWQPQVGLDEGISRMIAALTSSKS